jgi:hypothetical protein
MNSVFANFKHRLIDVGNGIKLNTVIGGSGEPLFLLHGFHRLGKSGKL